MKLKIEEIKVRPGRRYAQPEGIEALAESIKTIGLLNPVTVDASHTLIAGLHRLKAAELLGWTEIECRICDTDDLHAELVEIDENYVRTSLTPLESSKLLLRRKEIYEDLYPETKAGAAQGNGMKRSAAATMVPDTDLVDNLSARSVPKTFAEDTAEKLGVDPRTVRRQVKIAKDLTPEAQAVIEESDVKVTQQSLTKLSKLPQDEQKDAATWLVAEKNRSVDDYLERKKKNALSGNEKSVVIEVPPLPYKVECKEQHELSEIIADLKSPEGKNRCASPDAFMVDIVGFLNNFRKGLELYYDDHYSCVFSSVTKEQIEYLHDRVHDVCKELAELLAYVRNPENEDKTEEEKSC